MRVYSSPPSKVDFSPIRLARNPNHRPAGLPTFLVGLDTRPPHPCEAATLLTLVPSPAPGVATPLPIPAQETPRASFQRRTSNRNTGKLLFLQWTITNTSQGCQLASKFRKWLGLVTLPGSQRGGVLPCELASGRPTLLVFVPAFILQVIAGSSVGLSPGHSVGTDTTKWF